MVGRRLVGRRGRTNNEPLCVGGRQVISCGVGIDVIAIQDPLPLQRVIEEARPACGFIERQRRADHSGIIRSKSRKFELALTPGMAEAIAARHAVRDEVKSAAGELQPSRLIQHGSGIGERCDHQAVPISEHLVVKPGSHPQGARGEELFAQSREPRLIGVAARQRLQTI